MNLLEDVAGTLPGDKANMIGVIDHFLSMSQDERESFIVGRRIGRYRYLSDYVPIHDVEMIKRDIKSRFGSIDDGMLEILSNYI
jgi:hypothetical protein